MKASGKEYITCRIDHLHVFLILPYSSHHYHTFGCIQRRHTNKKSSVIDSYIDCCVFVPCLTVKTGIAEMLPIKPVLLLATISRILLLVYLSSPTFAVTITNSCKSITWSAEPNAPIFMFTYIGV